MSLDELGLSSDSELTGDESGQSEADFREYAKSLGVTEEDADLLWVAKEAFEAPLPSGWSEHFDPEGRVYFFSQVTQRSSWSHPLDDVFRELIQLIKSIRRLDPPEASIVEAVQSHLQSNHDRAAAALDGWSGPYVAEDGEYFCHFEQGVSTWHNPVEEWQTELAVRQQVLQRCLLHGLAKQASNGIPSSPDSEKSDVMPALPLQLARPSTDRDATPPSPSSARSFATCISARSTISVTPRSRRPSLCGSEVGSRNTSKTKPGLGRLPSRSTSGPLETAPLPTDGPDRSQNVQEPVERAEKPEPEKETVEKCEEEFEMTFGHGGVTLPNFGSKECDSTDSTKKNE